VTEAPRLARVLGTGDAVVVGLSAMLGAGVFVAFAPAAAASGDLLLLALAVAAGVAFCNAVASAQLASTYPASGGTYVFGREVLGPWWGFVAGWGFVIGKTASCAAIALTFAAYALPGASTTAQRVAAAVAVVVLTGANLVGITRTMLLARILLVGTLVTLTVAAGVLTTGDAPASIDPLPDGSALGVLEAAGLLFFAFAGYARIATLAEEVRTPATIGRAILVAFGVVITVYALLAVLLTRSLGSDLALVATPVADAVTGVGPSWATVVVRVGACVACLGSLLALLTGVGRTALAMARERDLPPVLATIDARHQVPQRAQAVIGLAVLALVLTFDVRDAIGFSSLGVLVYYAVANLAALRQPPAERRWPRGLQVVGLLGCLGLAVTLPTASVVAGVVVLAVGVIGRVVARRRDEVSIRDV